MRPRAGRRPGGSRTEARASAFARADQSSEWFRGGIVAYSSAVKYDVLGVPQGPVVSKAAAVAMARGAGRLLEADIAVAVTGVGGPDPRTATSRHGMDCYLA